MTRKDHFFEVVKRKDKDLRVFGVRKIGIFGSVARGDDTKNSDVDVLIQFEKGKKTYRNFLNVIELLEKEMGQEIELVTVESLSPYIGPYILEETQYASFDY